MTLSRKPYTQPSDEKARAVAFMREGLIRIGELAFLSQIPRATLYRWAKENSIDVEKARTLRVAAIWHDETLCNIS